MDLAPPTLDIPISRLLVEVQWTDADELEFKSSAKEVGQFSHALPQPVNHDVGTDIVQSGFDFNKVPAYIPKSGVNVKMPRAGQRHRFEQLLVVDGGAHLTVDYQAKVNKPEEPKGWKAWLSRCCSHRMA